ncbi:hypothetical protein Pmani_004684 [Petrolisthes manimaculis]|uniref:Uncharacterized protein n=1 Tax=Petrolisthes manimaculis TaxID=1843537 RepID=A0AAE1QD92_9EUCA|nr:hypothetical protein Pmani_004684 [Petrolisthes manimaculis]
MSLPNSTLPRLITPKTTTVPSGILLTTTTTTATRLTLPECKMTDDLDVDAMLEAPFKKEITYSVTVSHPP